MDKPNLSGNPVLIADSIAVIFKGDSWNDVYQTAAQEIILSKLGSVRSILTMNVCKTNRISHRNRVAACRLQTQSKEDTLLLFSLLCATD